MKRAAIISLILHGILFVFMFADITNPFRTVIKDNKPMIIDFVNVAEISAAPKLAPTNQKKQDQINPVEQKKEDVTPPPTPIEEKKTEPAQPKEEPKPVVKEEPKAEPKPAPKVDEKKPEPKPEPKKETAKVDPDAAPILKKEEPKKDDKKPLEKDKKKDEPKKEDPKKDDKKKKNESKKDDRKPLEKDKKKDKLSDKKEKKSDEKALINLRKTKPTDKDKKPDPKAKSSQKSLNDLLDKLVDEDGGESEGAPADSLGAQLTANEIDAVRQTIRKCWTFQAGAQGAKDIVVDIEMEMEADGRVKSADIMDKGRLAKDPAFRTAAESAKRAVLDPNCSPLPFPSKKYEQWKSIAFRFDPKDM